METKYIDKLTVEELKNVINYTDTKIVSKDGILFTPSNTNYTNQEINVKVQNALPESHLRDFLKLYKELGGTKLTLSTDAHSSNRYLEHFDKYVSIIKESGFNYLCYYIKQKEYDKAKEKLEYVIANGNKLYAVTEAKELLETLNNSEQQ